MDNKVTYGVILTIVVMIAGISTFVIIQGNNPNDTEDPIKDPTDNQNHIDDNENVENETVQFKYVVSMKYTDNRENIPREGLSIYTPMPFLWSPDENIFQHVVRTVEKNVKRVKSITWKIWKDNTLQIENGHVKELISPREQNVDNFFNVVGLEWSGRLVSTLAKENSQVMYENEVLRVKIPFKVSKENSDIVRIPGVFLNENPSKISGEIKTFNVRKEDNHLTNEEQLYPGKCRSVVKLCRKENGMYRTIEKYVGKQTSSNESTFILERTE